jgi:Family of unknown function (DUF5338)
LARVEFRALQPTIETELNAGWTAKAIYERHAEKLTNISYPQFVRYCRRLREASQPATPPTPETEGSNSARKGFAAHTGRLDPDLLRKLTSKG